MVITLHMGQLMVKDLTDTQWLAETLLRRRTEEGGGKRKDKNEHI